MLVRPIPFVSIDIMSLDATRLIVYLFVFILALLQPLPVCAKRVDVLIVHSYHGEHPWVIAYQEGLEEALADCGATWNFYMDTKRIGTAQFGKKAEEAWRLYGSRKFDLVILCDDSALEWLGPRLALTATPVVFLGINNNPRHYFADHQLPANFTGVLERPLLRRSISYLNRLDPRIKNVLVLFDDGKTGEIVYQEIFNQEGAGNILGTKVLLKRIGSWHEWQETVLQSHRHHDAMIVGLYHTLKDNRNQPVDSQLVIEWTAKNTPVPPFCFWDFAVGHDMTIGGLVIKGRDQGDGAGKIALDILKERRLPKSIRVKTPQGGQFVFSKIKLRQYDMILPEKIRQNAILIK